MYPGSAFVLPRQLGQCPVALLHGVTSRRPVCACGLAPNLPKLSCPLVCLSVTSIVGRIFVTGSSLCTP